MTLHDRTTEVINAVFSGLSLPGNGVDAVAVCYDRAQQDAVDCVRGWRRVLGFELREHFLEDLAVGPRCPSKAWNAALELVEEDHAFCISSDMVMAPHSIGMAYHLATVAPTAMIVGRAEHCGQSYAWEDGGYMHRTFTWSGKPSGLGFAWLIPMAAFRTVGGVDDIYMDGLCYEDDDLVLRMWEDGSDMLFCDDIVGFHLEHKRCHLKDHDGRVTVNEGIFAKRWGDVNHLRDSLFEHTSTRFNVGMALWSHKDDPDLRQRLSLRQSLYGQHEDWRAIPIKFLRKTEYSMEWSTDIPDEATS